MKVEIEFYDAKKAVPARSGDYLCKLDCSYMTIVWSKDKQGWNIAYDDSGERRNEMFPKMWAEVPEIEKGEEDNG